MENANEEARAMDRNSGHDATRPQQRSSLRERLRALWASSEANRAKRSSKQSSKLDSPRRDNALISHPSTSGVAESKREHSKREVIALDSDPEWNAPLPKRARTAGKGYPNPAHLDNEMPDSDSDSNIPSPKPARTDAKGHVNLAYFYNEMLPSPHVDESTMANNLLLDVLLKRFSDVSNVPGLKTTLYEYQKRSAMAMIRQEEDPKLLLDPRLEKRVYLNRSVEYVDCVTGETTQEPREYNTCRGGILAESMGLGYACPNMNML